MFLKFLNFILYFLFFFKESQVSRLNIKSKIYILFYCKNYYLYIIFGGSAKSTHLVKNQPTAWAQDFTEKSIQSRKINPKNTKPNGHTRIGHIFKSNSIDTSIYTYCRILAILIDLNIVLYTDQISTYNGFSKVLFPISAKNRSPCMMPLVLLVKKLYLRYK